MCVFVAPSKLTSLVTWCQFILGLFMRGFIIDVKRNSWMNVTRLRSAFIQNVKIRVNASTNLTKSNQNETEPQIIIEFGSCGPGGTWHLFSDGLLPQYPATGVNISKHPWVRYWQGANSWCCVSPSGCWCVIGCCFWGMWRTVIIWNASNLRKMLDKLQFLTLMMTLSWLWSTICLVDYECQVGTAGFWDLELVLTRLMSCCCCSRLDVLALACHFGRVTLVTHWKLQQLWCPLSERLCVNAWTNDITNKSLLLCQSLWLL